MKKINLRVFIFVQAMAAFCIPLYYHLMITYKLNSNVPFFISIVLMGIVILPFLFMEDTSSLFIGYLLTIGVFALIFIRACIFCWIDKNGME